MTWFKREEAGRIENASVKGVNEAKNTKIRHNADGNQISIHKIDAYKN